MGIDVFIILAMGGSVKSGKAPEREILEAVWWTARNGMKERSNYHPGVQEKRIRGCWVCKNTGRKRDAPIKRY